MRAIRRRCGCGSGRWRSRDRGSVTCAFTSCGAAHAFPCSNGAGHARRNRMTFLASKVVQSAGNPGGAWRSRTALDGFAIRCITALLTRRRITLLRHSTAKSLGPLHAPSATSPRDGRTPSRRAPETKRESQVSGSPSKIWSGKGVSNSRPQPWQGCALPTELFPRRTATNYSGKFPAVKTAARRAPAWAPDGQGRRGGTAARRYDSTFAIASATASTLCELSAATQMRPVSTA